MTFPKLCGSLTPADHRVHTLDPIVQRSAIDGIERFIEEMVRARLQISTGGQRELLPFSTPVRPQRKKEALRTRVYQEARSIADVVINRLGLKHPGRDLLKYYPGRGPSNAAILITLAQGVQNNRMGISPGERDGASIEQLQRALDASADIADQLTSMVRSAMGAKNGKSKVAR